MRSLKECYEIAKKYHEYWTHKKRDARFMCIAAQVAHYCGELTREEYRAVESDAMSLVKSRNKSTDSLRVALGNPTHKEVKAYWDGYIDNMENQG